MFADRHFYDDWYIIFKFRWNSSTYSEFARKWNLPVHEFLLRHVYLESMQTYNLSSNMAFLFTFVLSAILHELIFAVTGGRIRAYMFLFQLLQIPFIAVTRIPSVKRFKVAGKLFFWSCFFMVIQVIYVRVLQ